MVNNYKFIPQTARKYQSTTCHLLAVQQQVAHTNLRCHAITTSDYYTITNLAAEAQRSEFLGRRSMTVGIVELYGLALQAVTSRGLDVDIGEITANAATDTENIAARSGKFHIT